MEFLDLLDRFGGSGAGTSSGSRFIETCKKLKHVTTRIYGMLKTYGDAIGTNVILAAAGGKSRKINSISRNSSGKLVEESRFHPEHMTWNWTTMKTKTTASIIAIPLIVTTGFSMFSGTANADQHKQIVNGREVVVHSSPIPVILHRLVPPQHGRHVTQKEVASGKTLQQRPNTSVRKRP